MPNLTLRDAQDLQVAGSPSRRRSLGAFVSGIASAAILRRLELDIDVPSNAFAGRPVAVRVRLHNPRLWIPSFSVTVDAPNDKKKKRSGWQWQKSEFIFPKRQRWLQLPDYQLRRRPSPLKPPKVLTRPVD